MQEVQHMPTFFLWLSIFFFSLSLFVSLSLTSVNQLKIRKLRAEFVRLPKLYFCFSFLYRQNKTRLTDALEITGKLLRILFIILAVFYFYPFTSLLSTIIFILLILISILIMDVITFSLGKLSPLIGLRISALFTTLSFILFSFIVWPFILLKGKIQTEERESSLPSHERSIYWLKEHLLEILQENELLSLLSAADQKILKLLSSFWEKKVRQIMVPRIKTIMIFADATIEEAAHLFQKEGFSRLPIYQNREEIIGVLHYKKILEFYINHSTSPEKIKTTPVKEIASPAFFTPEIMRISLLLQEFRKKNTHLAIVVDEYGAPTGVVTIEDVLEEIVGEISDELDTEIEFFCTPLHDGSFLVSGSATLQDLDKEGIHISHPDEDTLSGLIIAHLGRIPYQQQKIEFENYTLEIVKATDRSVELVRIAYRLT